MLPRDQVELKVATDAGGTFFFFFFHKSDGEHCDEQAPRIGSKE